MKRLLLTALAATLLLMACRKSESAQENTNNLPVDNGCIERIIVPPTAHGIPPGEVAILNNLFQTNNINNSTYRYYQYLHNPNFQTLFPPFATFDDKVVKVDEYANGVRIFTGQLVFHFKNDVLNFTCCEPTAGTNLNTTPNLSLPQLRGLMINHIEQFDHLGQLYRDTCFKAEFGYFDLDAGISNMPERLVKAWRVTRKNSVYPAEYPVAYYEDKDGKLIYYHNGIVFSR